MSVDFKVQCLLFIQRLSFVLVVVRRTLKSGISPEDMEKLTKQVNILDSK